MASSDLIWMDLTKGHFHLDELDTQSLVDHVVCWVNAFVRVKAAPLIALTSWTGKEDFIQNYYNKEETKLNSTVIKGWRVFRAGVQG